MVALILPVVGSLLLASSHAFVSPIPVQSNQSMRPSRGSDLHLHEVSEALATAAGNFWLATIDGDIDAIPDNEFATVFAGGIAVMIGGVFSTMIVGLILDKGDLYANLAAESYLQSSEDGEFWKGLSDEEQKKTEEVIKKIKSAKGEGNVEASVATVDTDNKKHPRQPSKELEPTEASSAVKDMFSDYGD
eukprot:scaffold1352_cov144-Cylindrotheca_fusiformis.AAC.18